MLGLGAQRTPSAKNWDQPETQGAERGSHLEVSYAAELHQEGVVESSIGAGEARSRGVADESTIVKSVDLNATCLTGVSRHQLPKR